MLAAIKASVVHETDSLVFVCREKIAFELGLSPEVKVMIRQSNMVRHAFAPKKVTPVYPLKMALHIAPRGLMPKALIYFTCIDCENFSVLKWRFLKRRQHITQPETRPICTKCFKRSSPACVDTRKKMHAGRRAAWAVYRQQLPPKEAFTITAAFKAYIQQTYCQRQQPTNKDSSI